MWQLLRFPVTPSLCPRPSFLSCRLASNFPDTSSVRSGITLSGICGIWNRLRILSARSNTVPNPAPFEQFDQVQLFKDVGYSAHENRKRMDLSAGSCLLWNHFAVEILVWTARLVQLGMSVLP
ncbi:hypothetical protein O3P69_013421 [Scylla paramamosain]|uniref:Uncharacterized protein n=1 Tax=Scylla paramamosain TaxID=85552 RepID=A0AAW0U050_SCYPA